MSHDASRADSHRCACARCRYRYCKASCRAPSSYGCRYRYAVGADVRDAIEMGAVEGPRMATGGSALLTAVRGAPGMVVRGPDDIVQTVRRQVKRLPVLPPRPSMGRGRSLRSPQPSHAPSMFTGGAGRRLDQAAREQYASRDPSTTLAVSHRRMSSMHRPPRARRTASMRPTQRLYLAGRIPRQLCRGHIAVWTAEEIRLACDTAHARHATRTMLCARWSRA